MRLTIWTSLRMRLLEAVHGRKQALIGKFAQLRIWLARVASCADRLAKFAMLSACSLCVLESSATSVFNVPSSFEQFRLALGAHGFRAADFRLNLADGFFNHVRENLLLAVNSARLTGLQLAVSMLKVLRGHFQKILPSNSAFDARIGVFGTTNEPEF